MPGWKDEPGRPICALCRGKGCVRQMLPRVGMRRCALCSLPCSLVSPCRNSTDLQWPPEACLFVVGARDPAALPAFPAPVDCDGECKGAALCYSLGCQNGDMSFEGAFAPCAGAQGVCDACYPDSACGGMLLSLSCRCVCIYLHQVCSCLLLLAARPPEQASALSAALPAWGMIVLIHISCTYGVIVHF